LLRSPSGAMSNFPRETAWLGSVQLSSGQVRKHERVTDSSLSAGEGEGGRDIQKSDKRVRSLEELLISVNNLQTQTVSIHSIVRDRNFDI
jgi:hypothetical protein